MAGRGLGRGFDSLIPTDIVENYCISGCKRKPVD